ncbi:hypothetical protein [Olsenella profusa]|uniref:Uncharacterized protein n=1 Tax=Olsenella profusa F0195 TaxID=1125712 RepID=U2TKC1_9ACTN|nr:hypothetical protein [Olsenella profusa]ERL06905.1 hypothetical protein HMPREF1316_1021 [Olsenella profusa F0195]
MILFVAGVVAVAVGLLATRAWRYHVERDQERQEAERQARVERYGDEFQPLLERARAIMDGTADPAPSEERDGELCDWAFARRREYYPDVVRFDISPIELLDVEFEGDDEATLTVSFSRTGYRADGAVDMRSSHSSDKWHVRKEGSDWVVYKIETKP